MEHVIHVEQGPEYQGETYIWCECLAGKENLIERYHMDNAPDGALFEGTGAIGLLEWLSQHTPGISVEDTPVTGLYVNCSFPVREDVKAASDTCQHSADSAVRVSDDVFGYRCPAHRHMIDARRRGQTLWTVPRVKGIGKVIAG
jgi:hypothetical protein